jgi:dihydroorotate dehydrogenase electron transfer subunit
LDLRTVDLIRDTQIEKVVQESSNIRSFYFKDEQSLRAKPGQFVMIWMPDAGEFPMSVSLPSVNGLASIGVKAMGSGSKALYEAQVGDYLGVRGPYGKGFDLESNHLDPSWRRRKISKALIVGGGTGMVPMIVVAKALVNKSVKTFFVIGARTKAELAYVKSAKKIVGTKAVFASTDDGSFGFKGLAHELVGDLVSKDKFDEIFACGPEKMMARVFEIARREKIPVQFSLERIMKCGIGICGSCTIGDYVLCKDGPVLSSRELKHVKKEFGVLHRNMSGNTSPI